MSRISFVELPSSDLASARSFYADAFGLAFTDFGPSYSCTFGTGYSSLSYLQHFELDGLKLDKSFLQNADKKRQATQIIRAVIEFGHSLDMRVVVEGVESEWQARLLQLLGCDLLQGFEIGVPMTLNAFHIYRKELAAVQFAKPVEPAVLHPAVNTG